MQYRLYYSQFCFFCQKVLMALNGHQHGIEMTDTSNHQHRSDLIAGGGKGQVPCLRIENEKGAVSWVYESDDILTYLRTQQLVS